MISNGMPSLTSGNLPDVEWEDARHIQFLLYQLNSYIERYDHALKLFDFASLLGKQALKDSDAAKDWDKKETLYGERKIFASWKVIAASDAAMTVNHVDIVLKNLKVGTKDSPVLKSLIVHSLLRKARRNFAEYFPDALVARNAVSHSAEIASTSKKISERAITKPFETNTMSLTGTTIVSNSLFGDSMVSSMKNPHTREATVVSAPLNQACLEKLIEIRQMVFSAFALADPSYKFSS